MCKYKFSFYSYFILRIYTVWVVISAFFRGGSLRDPSGISLAEAITNHVRNPLGTAVLCWMLTGSHAVDFFARMRAIREGIEQSRSSDNVQKFPGS